MVNVIRSETAEAQRPRWAAHLTRRKDRHYDVQASSRIRRRVDVEDGTLSGLFLAEWMSADKTVCGGRMEGMPGRYMCTLDGIADDFDIVMIERDAPAHEPHPSQELVILGLSAVALTGAILVLTGKRREPAAA